MQSIGCNGVNIQHKRLLSAFGCPDKQFVTHHRPANDTKVLPSCLLFYKLYSSVLRSSFVCGVIGYGRGLSFAGGGQAVAGDAVFH